MADTTTPLLGLLLQGTGGNNNSWGDNLNTAVITLIENAIAGQVVITSVGGTYTLNAVEARASTLLLSNTLTSDLTIVVPDTAKNYRIVNYNVVNGFFTLLKCATAATKINVPRSKTTEIVVASGVPYRSDRAEVGRYVYDAASVNGDAVECDGTAYKRATLPDLFAKLGTTYGTNDSTDFKVPNAYDTGRYLRSRTASVTVGTAQASQNKAHTHTGSGTTGAMSANATHNHTTGAMSANATHNHTGSGTTGAMSANATHTHTGTTGTESVTHTHGITGAPAVGTLATASDGAHTHGNTLTDPGHVHPATGVNVFFASVSAGANQLASFNVGSGNPTPGLMASTNTTGITINNASAGAHTHSITGAPSAGSLGTAANSVLHTHSFTTDATSIAHTHDYSFTSSTTNIDHTHTVSTVNLDHTHTYSFTTSGGSADGTEARPESLVSILCIKY